MKFIATFVLGLMFSMAAQAEVRSEITSVKTLSYDGQTLALSYGVGGGCQPHTTDVKVEISQLSQFSYRAVVTVEDVTPAPDYCEAYLFREASVDLSEKIKLALTALGIQPSSVGQVDVQLPLVENQINN